MKVRITFDLSDEALVGINVVDGGPIKPAKRDDARQYIINLVEERVASLESGFQKFLQRFTDEYGTLYVEGEAKDGSDKV